MAFGKDGLVKAGNGENLYIVKDKDGKVVNTVMSKDKIKSNKGETVEKLDKCF